MNNSAIAYQPRSPYQYNTYIRAKMERLKRAIQKWSIEIQQIRDNPHLEIAQSPNQEWGNYFENIRLSYRAELAELERCLELVFHH